MERPRIGLALGSGSARGWAHIGVIEALAEAGIEAEIVCGSSIGALVGAAQVCGRLPALRDWACAATWREIVGLIDVRLAGGGVVDGALVVAFLRGLGIEAPIETLSTPYAAVATDLRSGREVWLRTGPIDAAVRASIAMPGLFRPVWHDGLWLSDGGLANPVPVSVCRALGAEIIIAVNLNGDLLGRRFDTDAQAEAPRAEFLDRALSRLPPGVRAPAEQLLRRGPAQPGYFDVLANTINIMQDQITRSRLAGEPPHVLLAPRLRDIGLLEFNRAPEAIAEGRACVEQALPLLRRYL